jgi:alpha-glucosidase (family GH31 glycosyl hydrolase)
MPYQLNNDTTQYQDLSTYYLPFVPAFKYSGALDNMSISLNGTLGNPTRYSTLLVRNGMAGWAIKRTYNVIQQSILKNNTRALLFSDASWAGSGAYSAALLTEQYRSWNDMQNVINQVLALSMYGFSATMVDTCGSLGPMDEDLCARWTQLATFMPMVRNYFNETYRDPATGQRMKTPNSEPWNA